MQKLNKKEPIKLGKSEVLPHKVVKHRRTNRYFVGEKVTVVSEKYMTAKITKVWVRDKKLVYCAVCGDGTVLNKVPEEAFLPHIKKWQYNFIKWLGKIGFNIVST